MNSKFSQSADSVLNDEFEDSRFRPDSDTDRPVWSDDAFLTVNNNAKSSVDGPQGRIGGFHGFRKKKRSHTFNKKFNLDEGVSSASFTFLAGQSGFNDGGRPLPAPPGSHRVPVMGIGALSGPVVEYPVSDSVLPLLHRIVKTIGIWYHPQIDRSKAMNLLMTAEMGCFILRKSSRESSLALTVRNARPHDCDHYLIFDRPSGHQIEGSFLTFQTIPKLIEYYCVHLRELPYLLKLPDVVANCSCDRLLETYNNMGADFWSKYYSPNTPAPHHLRRQQPPFGEVNPPSTLTSKGAVNIDNWLLTSSPAPPIVPPPPTVPPPPAPNVSSAPERVSGTFSADNLACNVPNFSSTSHTSASGVSKMTDQMTSNKTRSVDSLNDPTRQRTSILLRVSQTSSSHMPSYDAMWEMSEGPTSSPLLPPPPPLHPPPPINDPHIQNLSGFPHPDRFRQKFTFEGLVQPHSEKQTIVYNDPIDLTCDDEKDYVPPVPPPRRASRSRGGRPPLGAKAAIPPDLRTAQSDESLNRRVEASIKEINRSIDAMEADLEPNVAEPKTFSFTASVSNRSSTVSDTYGDSQLGKMDSSRRRRLSQYDNVSVCSNRSLRSLPPTSVVSVASSRGTIFSAPWDNSMWHQVLQPADRDTSTMEVLHRIAKQHDDDDDLDEDDNDNDDDHKRYSPVSDDATPTILLRNSGHDDKTPVPQQRVDEAMGEEQPLNEDAVGHDMVKRAKARICESAPGSNSRNVGAAIEKWLADLAVNPHLMLGEKLKSFVECTRDASERNPHSVMRNVRQFMDGIKHYLVQRDETGFHTMIERERKKLGPGEFLNVERRLESALYTLILEPLKKHLDNLMIDWHHQHGNLQRVRDNIRLASKHTPERLGIRNGLQTPSEEDLTRIQQLFRKMEDAFSPLEKLESLLAVVEIIYSNVSETADNSSSQLLSTDEYHLMPVFTYVLVRCELVSAEMEAEYMQGLLASKFLLGEGAYYLATLQAAVTVIKNFHRRPSVGNMTASFEDLSQMHGVLRVIVLDERTDSTNLKTFPARPTMTARDLSILVAHRCHIFNPQDFSLYHSKHGTETILKDLDLPYKIKVECEGQTSKQCHFLYRRTHAVFALPLSLSCGR